jgi:hypothetical protein
MAGLAQRTMAGNVGGLGCDGAPDPRAVGSRCDVFCVAMPCSRSSSRHSYSIPPMESQVDLLGALVSGVKHLASQGAPWLVRRWPSARFRAGQKPERRSDPAVAWTGLPPGDLPQRAFGRNYPHYFITWLPWVAVASALLVSRLSEPYAAPNDWLRLRCSRDWL